MKGLHTILIFLSIEGAFDNAWWPAILNLLKKNEANSLCVKRCCGFAEGQEC